MVGVLQRIGDYQCDRLTLMADPVILKHVQPLAGYRINSRLVLAISQLRRVSVREDGENSRRLLRSLAVDRSDASTGRSTAHDHTMRLASRVELRSISCCAGDFLSAIRSEERRVGKACRSRW